MESLGKLFLSLEKLTGLGFFGDLGKPLLKVVDQKKGVERAIAQKKSEALAVKSNFDKLKPKDKVS